MISAETIIWALRCSSTPSPEGTCDCDRIAQDAADMLEKLQKYDVYGWHDLKKDPKDVPDFRFTEYMYGELLVCTENPNNPGVRTYKKDKFSNLVNEFMNTPKPRVIAWKYLEPFEEEKC